MQIFKEYEELIKELIQIAKSLKIPITDDIGKLYNVFCYRQISLLECIQELCKKEKWYEACILNTTLIENYILQIWLINNHKIIRYLEYACIESLPRLKIYKSEIEGILTFIKKHNLTSYLKSGITHSDGNLLKIENYIKPEWGNLQRMVNQLVKDYNLTDILVLKKHYDILCGIKHSNAYAILSRMTGKFEEDAALAYQNACHTFFCQLVSMDISYHFVGLKEKLKNLYKKHSQLVSEIKTYYKKF